MLSILIIMTILYYTVSMDGVMSLISLMTNCLLESFDTLTVPTNNSPKVRLIFKILIDNIVSFTPLKDFPTKDHNLKCDCMSALIVVYGLYETAINERMCKFLEISEARDNEHEYIKKANSLKECHKFFNIYKAIQSNNETYMKYDEIKRQFIIKIK